MRLLIVDGYTDEPSRLGVPPFIAPLPRYLYGAATLAGYDVVYKTIDDFRRIVKARRYEDWAWREFFGSADILVTVFSAVVPGTYLTTRPASSQEVLAIGRRFEGTRILTGAATLGLEQVKGGKEVAEAYDYVVTGDIDRFITDYMDKGRGDEIARATISERERALIAGARGVREVLNYPLEHTICEIDTYYGCHRYRSGGCSFCIEPLYGQPQYRMVGDVWAEIKALYENGIRHIRMGGQSCILSYLSEDMARDGVPRPNVTELERFFKGIWQVAQGLKTLHVDNANPAVVAASKEGTRAVKVIVRYTTPGNVLAFGLESADPTVGEENNLNTTAEECLEAVRIVNRFGREYGSNGMPLLLPGINLVLGLKGERRESLEANREFLTNLLKQDLWVRRINVRTVVPSRPGFQCAKKWRHYDRDVRRFVRFVRERIERVIMERMLPPGHVLRHVVAMVHKGGSTLGKQIASYGLTVVVPYSIPIHNVFDATVLRARERSVLGMERPLNINTMPASALKHIPFLSPSTVRAIRARRPFNDWKELYQCGLDDSAIDNLQRFGLKIA